MVYNTLPLTFYHVTSLVVFNDSLFRETQRIAMSSDGLVHTSSERNIVKCTLG
jgi:hypothetical protein